MARRDLVRTIVGSLSDRRSRRSSSPVGAVLMYHGVAEEPGDPECSTSAPLSLTSFRAGIEHLARRYDVVSIHELRHRAAMRAKGKRLPVALTFDDDLQSHRSLVAPLLGHLGMPATFFLTGCSLDARHAFWWEDLEALFARGASTRQEVLRQAGLGSDAFATGAGIMMVSSTLQMMPPERRDALAAWMREMVGEEPREPGLRAADVRALAGAGYEIGFHTRAHYQLQTLTDEALARAMREGLDELAQAAGTPIDAIAYPHAGGDLRIAGAAAAAGFKLGFVGNNRPTSPSAHPLLIERIDAWPCSADGFEFRLARIISHG